MFVTLALFPPFLSLLSSLYHFTLVYWWHTLPPSFPPPQGGTDGYIQNITALVMLLVQSCVTAAPVVGAHCPPQVIAIVREGHSTPTNDSGSRVVRHQEESASKRQKRQEHHYRQQQQQSGLGPARSAASYFVSRFLSRCALAYLFFWFHVKKMEAHAHGNYC